MIKVFIFNFYLFIRLHLGFRPFIHANSSKKGPCFKEFKASYLQEVKYRFITLVRWLKTDHELYLKAEDNLHKDVLRTLKRKTKHFKGDIERPLPELSADINPVKFFQEYVKRPHPVVIRGLAKDLPAVVKWNKAYMEERYGDTEVLVDTIKYNLEKSDIYFNEAHTTLREAVNTAGAYLNASSDVFRVNPELEEDLAPIQEWAKYLHGAKLLMSQAFMGFKSEGAPFHCASAWNFFIMIDGEKEWTFVNPEYSLQMGAIVHPSVISVESCVTGKGGTWRDTQELYTKYCPRFKTVVRKGDVLLNPPWWWHEIKNITPFTIGVSSRWLSMRYVATNTFYDLLSVFSPSVWKVQKQVIELLKIPYDQRKNEIDVLRQIVKRNQPGKEKYFADFLNRSKQKIF